MSLAAIFPFLLLIGAMLLMTRSAKKKQQAAAQMRNEMEPGSGVRTIGGMYATVKEVHEDTVLLEVAPGVYAVYAKNAIGSVLDDDEYNRIVHGEDDSDTPVVPDDASSLTDPDDLAAADGARIDLGKKPEGESAAAEDAGTEKPEVKDAVTADAEAAEVKDAGAKDAKADGEADAK
ncbi:preprotein translocase subunit YajC [Streptomyces corynorhini]|uniref:Preprotein translocase subunit YajC n=1 Tax=Streptomyces corynorhini TaxID=2282652 RepID=A0A370BGM4_9ACTN|nr:preprotein translocase subunit YajC [Streptomyces corynorhini]RDG38555.1 preprotein translocase subunit YajC [Streptomyces corynorhini]